MTDHPTDLADQGEDGDDTPRNGIARTFAGLAALGLSVPALIGFFLVHLAFGGCEGTVECYDGETPRLALVPFTLYTAAVGSVLGSLAIVAAADTAETRRRWFRGLPRFVALLVVAQAAYRLLKWVLDLTL